MVNKEYLGRGIHSPKFLSSLKNGKLKGMLEVVNADENLDIQIREDYLNIYYRGGNIAKVNSENSIDFDKFYFYLGTDKVPKKEAEKDTTLCLNLKKQRDELINHFKEGDYQTFFSQAKLVLDAWFSCYSKSKAEREEQHQLSLHNRDWQFGFVIIDIEYQVSRLSPFKYENGEKEKYPRFDIIAVKDGSIYVIELKKGTKALSNKSGLQDHWDSYKYSIDRYPIPFTKEMKNLIEQKQMLGLIDKHIQITSEKPIFAIAYAYDDKEPSSEEQWKALMRECEKIRDTSISIPIIRVSNNKLEDVWK
jgi:hypothetical protein